MVGIVFLLSNTDFRSVRYQTIKLSYMGALYQLDEICRIMGDFPPPPPIFGAVHQTNSRHMSKVSCSVRMEEEQRREKELFEFFHSHLNLAVTSLAFEHIFKPVSPFSRDLINTHI